MSEAMRQQSAERFIIDPKQYGRHGFYVGCLIAFWLIWAPMTAVVTACAISRTDAMLFVWLIFGYPGTFGVPMAIWSRNRKQVVEIRGDELLVTGTGVFPSSTVRISRVDLDSLTLEHFD